MCALAFRSALWFAASGSTVHAAPKNETRSTCGGYYGWGYYGPPCPDPTWEPRWQLNLSTMSSWKENVSGFYDPHKAAGWGMVTFDWSIGFDQWKHISPHPGEAALLEQCRMVKAVGTGTRCMVYRQNSLSLQWQASSRRVQTSANSSLFLQFATQKLCDAAPTCAAARLHIDPSRHFCCNFSRVYNEPLAPRTPGTDPGFGNGQLFWDFRRQEVVDYWAEQVALDATANEFVDGLFVDDPAGYNEEHPQITGQVQLSQRDMDTYYTGIQTAWNRALHLLRANKKCGFAFDCCCSYRAGMHACFMSNTVSALQDLVTFLLFTRVYCFAGCTHCRYIFQAYQGPLNAVGPGVVGNPSSSNVTECAAWLREACAKRDNESARIYSGPSNNDMHDAKMSIATFLIARGPHSMITADPSIIEDQRGNHSNPFYNLFYLDVGTPLQHCVESPRGVFSRLWSRGKVSIDCSARRLSPLPYLDFPRIPLKMDDRLLGAEQQHLVLLRHDPDGLRWLDARWKAVSDPLSPDYRLHESQNEILCHLVPHMATQTLEIERWLGRNGWTIMRHLGDALLVRPSQYNTSAQLQSFAEVDRPEAVALIVSTRSTGAVSGSSHTLQRVSSPLPVGLSTSTLREMYSVPENANASGIRVSNWQGGKCKVYRNDIANFCKLSGSLGDCMSQVDTSIGNATDNVSNACIEADLDTEMLLSSAPSVVSVVGSNGANGGSFLAWAVDWFNSSGYGVPQVASVSWGGSEGGGHANTPAENSTQMRLNVELQKLGVLGRAVFWASGDGGVGGACDPLRGCNYTSQGFKPSWPATSPFVTACGGTELSDPSIEPLSSADPICKEVVKSGFGRGCASGVLRSSGERGEVATSLTVSGFSSGGGFSWWFSRPSWQDKVVKEYLMQQRTSDSSRRSNAGRRLPPSKLWNAAGRGFPDVSSAAGNLAIFTNGAAWLGGGTSAAAPWWAGVWAMATAVSIQTTGKALGPANPLLYHLASSQPECFYDIQVGDNRCPFGPIWQGKSCNCSSCEGFETAKGWDPVTGLGTPNVSCILDAVRRLPQPRSIRTSESER